MRFLFPLWITLFLVLAFGFPRASHTQLDDSSLAPEPLPAAHRAPSLIPVIDGGQREVQSLERRPAMAFEATETVWIGVVTDQAGRELPGVQVSLQVTQGQRDQLRSGSPLGEEAVTSKRSVVTDLAGGYRFQAPEESEVELHYSSAGYQPRTLRAKFPDIPAVALQRSVEMYLLVEDSTGSSLAGAELLLEGEPTQTSVGCTGEDGVLRMLCRAGTELAVVVRHPRHGASSHVVKTPNTGVGEQTLSLPRRCWLRGRISGMPRDGVPRCLSVERMDTSDSLVTQVSTDEEGFFEVAGLEFETRYRIHGVEEEQLGEELPCTDTLVWDSAQENPQLPYLPGNRLIVQVTGSRTGQSIERFAVSAAWKKSEGDDQEWLGGLPQELMHDRFAVHPNGVAEIGPLRPSLVGRVLHLRVTAPGFSTGEVDVELAPGLATRRVRAILDPFSDLRVLVQDELGQPVAGADVAVDGAGSEMLEPSLHGLTQEEVEKFAWTPSFGTTDAKGVCHLPRAASDALALRVWASGHVPWQVDHLDVPDEGLLRVTLQGAASLRIKVVDAAGKPLAGSPVHLASDGRCRETNATGELVLSNLAPGIERVRLASTFQGHLTDLPPWMERSSDSPLVDGWVAVQLALGHTAEVVLRAEVQGNLEGQVFLGGQELASARLRLERVPPVGSLVGDPLLLFGDLERCDAWGRFRFANVPAGRYRLVAMHADLAFAHSFEVLLGEGDQSLRLDLISRAVSGFVYLPGGEPARDARIAAVPVTESWRADLSSVEALLRKGDWLGATRADASGAYQLCGLPFHDEVLLLAVLPGHVLATLELETGVATQADLHFTQGQRLEVFWAATAPQSGFIHLRGPKGLGRELPIEGTNLVFDGLPAGSWSLVWSDAQGNRVQEPREVWLAGSEPSLVRLEGGS